MVFGEFAWCGYHICTSHLPDSLCSKMDEYQTTALLGTKEATIEKKQVFTNGSFEMKSELSKIVSGG
ncbi:MAG: hypothetical protein ACXADB_10335 [Candidatus Hermodarchaeia archaeon]